uniref:Uncharacterized protein n=1 Tax=Rhizophora mucronata TaxID=61149 RepID=A0A2P2NCF4_RHIMU
MLNGQSKRDLYACGCNEEMGNMQSFKTELCVSLESHTVESQI